MTDTVETLISAAADALAEAGIENGRAEARLLLGHALGVAAESLIADNQREVSRSERGAFRRLLARRRKREPMSHIRGRREFWSLNFRVTRDTLDPRPDSETLIDALLQNAGDRAAPRRILDFGTGTGCLLLAALSELPAATGLGVDISAAAIRIARENAESLGLAGRAEFLKSDWAKGPEGQFDIILANPPYIPTADLARLAPEVGKYEPKLALDGGPDGLEACRVLLPRIAGLLARDGVALVEIGADQGLNASALASAAGFSRCEMRSDLAGRPRCLILGFDHG